MKADKSTKLTAISLFSSGGIGDLSLKNLNVDVLVANELLESRVKLFRRNFPNTNMIQGDIWTEKQRIIDETKKALNGKTLDIVLATPPCQGMSKNGQGKLLKHIREGKRAEIDPRNRLIIPTLEIIVELKPRLIVFENVPEMANTIIDTPDGEYINIIDFIQRELNGNYRGKAEVVHFADYGIPQRRMRLITIFTNIENQLKTLDKEKTLLPKATHSPKGNLWTKPWVTVRNKIADLPKLDSKSKELAESDIPFHEVAVLDEKKYFWIENTPPEKGAFDNQCINPKCKFQKNPTHGSTKNGDGINQSNKNTPLYCIKCGELLPRPYVKTSNGELRLMNGYTSAYKRMSWDLPASTLTTNFPYPSSDNKLHPEQNRVLSIHEALVLHTLNCYEYFWEYDDKKKASKQDIIEVIGESIPPKGLEIIFAHLINYL